MKVLTFCLFSRSIGSELNRGRGVLIFGPLKTPTAFQSLKYNNLLYLPDSSCLTLHICPAQPVEDLYIQLNAEYGHVTLVLSDLSVTYPPTAMAQVP